MLRELNLKPKQKGGKDAQQPGILRVTPQPQPSGKKSKQGVSLDLSAMIDALEVHVALCLLFCISLELCYSDIPFVCILYLQSTVYKCEGWKCELTKFELS